MIRLSHVSKTFDDGRSYAVKDLSFHVDEAETLVLLGSSGCGKTTTLKRKGKKVSHLAQWINNWLVFCFLIVCIHGQSMENRIRRRSVSCVIPWKWTKGHFSWWSRSPHILGCDRRNGWQLWWHFRRISRSLKEDRDLLVYLVWKICILSNEETGRLFGMTYSAISHILGSMRTRMQKDSELRVKYNNVYSLCKMWYHASSHKRNKIVDTFRNYFCTLFYDTFLSNNISRE